MSAGQPVRERMLLGLRVCTLILPARHGLCFSFEAGLVSQWSRPRSLREDTIAFERVPSGMEVHVHLLVESGIHIIEALNLEQLANDRVYEFLFVAIPMKIAGATGSPVRPIALV